MNETASIPAPRAGGDAELAAVAEVPAAHEGGAQLGSVLAVSDKMVGLTWLAFLLACFALYKLAWKPISTALDRREDKIRQSLKEAADIQAQAAMISYVDDFKLMMWVTLASVPLVLLLRSPKPGGPKASAADMGH